MADQPGPWQDVQIADQPGPGPDVQLPRRRFQEQLADDLGNSCSDSGQSPESRSGHTSANTCDSNGEQLWSTPVYRPNSATNFGGFRFGDEASNAASGTSVVTSVATQTAMFEGVDTDNELLRAAVTLNSNVLLETDVRLSSKAAGRGTFGEVRRGIYSGCTEVAVKVPRMKGGKLSPGGLETLANELLILRDVHHENIVAFHGCVELDGLMCLVMEWVGGGDFRQYVRSRRKREAFKAEYAAKSSLGDLSVLMSEQKILVDVSRGMLYLHSREKPVLHLDLKPENILVEEGEPPCGKIADFGLGTLLHAGAESPSSVVGTRAYMSPEVSAGKKYGLPADVFSFGCVCLFVVRGQHLSNPPTVTECQWCLSISAPAFFPTTIMQVASNCVVPNPAKRINFEVISASLAKNLFLGPDLLCEASEETLLSERRARREKIRKKPIEKNGKEAQKMAIALSRQTEAVQLVKEQPNTTTARTLISL
eukprot:TRINITY_DN124292_c0_g1_i1.p1 TRINITY_DN124292_c0_g1~~TRINITY_DN124292_c0_g1_i1.p1  ORF type:complete len:481 (+),score=70.65 TRINITY_DN124292_c0_g1_i1:186-1628(+)